MAAVRVCAVYYVQLQVNQEFLANFLRNGTICARQDQNCFASAAAATVYTKRKKMMTKRNMHCTHTPCVVARNAIRSFVRLNVHETVNPLITRHLVNGRELREIKCMRTITLMCSCALLNVKLRVALRRTSQNIKNRNKKNYEKMKERSNVQNGTEENPE